MLMETSNLNGNLIAELGLQDASEETRYGILNRAIELVVKGVVLRLVKDLTEDDVARVNALAGNPDDQLVFLASKTPNFQELLNEETERVKTELKQAVAIPEA